MNKNKKTNSSLEMNSNNFDDSNDYSTLADLMKEQGVSTDLADYWDKECDLNPSNPKGLVLEDE